MKKYLVLPMILFTKLAYAQSPLPELNDIRASGRVIAFLGSGQNIWFTPTAFSSELACSASNQTSSCVLRIMNQLTDQERDDLAKIANPGQQLLALGDADSRITYGIGGDFKNLHSTLATHTLVMNTLAMSDTFPYASAVARLGQSDTVALQSDYLVGGIGTFVTKFFLNGIVLGDQLKLTDTHALTETFKSLLGKTIHSSDLRIRLQAAFRNSQPVIKHFTFDEAAVIAYRFLLTHYFSRNPNGKFSLNANYDVASKLDIVDETEYKKLICETTLELRKGAASTTQCEEYNE